MTDWDAEARAVFDWMDEPVVMAEIDDCREQVYLDAAALARRAEQEGMNHQSRHDRDRGESEPGRIPHSGVLARECTRCQEAGYRRGLERSRILVERHQHAHFETLHPGECVPLILAALRREIKGAGSLPAGQAKPPA